jgi:hypothetical protein
MNMFFPCDFARNLIDFHVCPLYRHIHKCSFTLSIQNGRFPRLYDLVFEGWPVCPDFCTALYKNTRSMTSHTVSSGILDAISFKKSIRFYK